MGERATVEGTNSQMFILVQNHCILWQFLKGLMMKMKNKNNNKIENNLKVFLGRGESTHSWRLYLKIRANLMSVSSGESIPLWTYVFINLVENLFFHRAREKPIMQ